MDGPCVLDASVAVALVSPDEAGDISPERQSMLVAGGIVVPGLWALECLNVLALKRRRSTMQDDTFELAVAALRALSPQVDHLSVDATVTDVLPLALKHGLTLYDAAYLELALRRGCSLATLDSRLKQAAQRAGIILFPLKT